MLALPAKAIVKLRPGSVFEALQSCCLAFCNVLLVWLAPGLLPACSWLVYGLFMTLGRPGVSQAQSKKQPRSNTGACPEQARNKPGAGQEQARSRPGASQEQARSRQGPKAKTKPETSQGHARSRPGASHTAIRCKMQGSSSARLQKHCQGATLRLRLLAGPTQNLQS